MTKRDPRETNTRTYTGHGSRKVKCAHSDSCTNSSCLHRKVHFMRRYEGSCFLSRDLCDMDRLLCKYAEGTVLCQEV